MCHGSENQRWTITASQDNKRAIIGIGGYCLDVRGNGPQGNGTPTQLWKCHFGDNQRFAFSPDGRIREVRTGKCLIAVAPQMARRSFSTPAEILRRRSSRLRR